MEWTRQDDEAFTELMETYDMALPAIQRIVQQDEQMAELQRQIDDIVARVGQFNPLLDHVKKQKERTA